MDKALQERIARVLLLEGTSEQQKEIISHLPKGTLLTDLANATMTLEKKQMDLAQIIRELLDRLSPPGFEVPKRFVHGDPLAVRALNAIQGIPKP